MLCLFSIILDHFLRKVTVVNNWADQTIAQKANPRYTNRNGLENECESCWFFSKASKTVMRINFSSWALRRNNIIIIICLRTHNHQVDNSETIKSNRYSILLHTRILHWFVITDACVQCTFYYMIMRYHTARIFSFEIKY